MPRNLSRRQVLMGSVALAAASGCSRRRASGSEPRVSVIRAEYGGRLYDSVRRLLVDHKADIRGRHIVIKPNLVEFDAETAINTHPMLVAATLEACRSLGAAGVRIAEGPGHRR